VPTVAPLAIIGAAGCVLVWSLIGIRVLHRRADRQA
jgi:hypothetical protein